MSRRAQERAGAPSPATSAAGAERRGQTPPPRRLLSLAAPLALALLSSQGRAQVPEGPELEAIRDGLRESLHDVHFAAALAGLVLVSDEIELSGARYAVDDDVDTALSVLALPFHTVAAPWGEEAPGLHLEGVAGYGRATQDVDDVYAGGIPGLETAVDAGWASLGGLLGAGPAFRLADGLVLTVVANVGVAWVESAADYEGPGAPFTAALLDGIGLNWEAWVLSGGGALRVGWVRALGARHRLEVLGRHDVRVSTTVASSDRAQEFSARLQVSTARADVTGPTGLSPFGAPLGWRATTGYRRFLEGTMFGVRDVVQLGGALELGVAGRLPLLRLLRLNGSVVFGGAVAGWTLGGGASF